LTAKLPEFISPVSRDPVESLSSYVHPRRVKLIEEEEVDELGVPLRFPSRIFGEIEIG